MNGMESARERERPMVDLPLKEMTKAEAEAKVRNGRRMARC